MENMIILNSVGAAYNSETRELYPLWDNGTIDYDLPTSIDSVNEEWFDLLSIEDHEILFEIL